jgi:hypothetical protein
MGRTRVAVAAALVAALLASAVGCGEDDADQFREDYNALSERLQRTGREIGSLSPGDPQRLADQLDTVADRADEARRDLAELDPPDDAGDELDALVAAVKAGVEDIRAVADAARSGDQQQIVEAADELSKTGQEINDAERALKRAVDG